MSIRERDAADHTASVDYNNIYAVATAAHADRRTLLAALDALVEAAEATLDFLDEDYALNAESALHKAIAAAKEASDG